MAAENWGRAADEVERRMAELRMSRTRLADLAEVDRKTVDNFLDRHVKPRTTSRGGYEAALGWRYGSLTDVARGGEPTVIGTGYAASAITEDAVIEWLRMHLPPHLGEHIVNQYYILKSAAGASGGSATSPPLDPIQGRGDAGERSTSRTLPLSPSSDDDPLDEPMARR